MIRGGYLLPSQRLMRGSHIRPKTVLVWKCRRCEALYDALPRYGVKGRCACEGVEFKRVRVPD